MSSHHQNYIDDAVEAATLYTQAELDHFKLRAAKAITTWSSRIVSSFITVLSIVLILIFLGLAGALYLQHFVNPEMAYLIVALFYALIGLITVAFRKKIIEPIVLKVTLQELFDEP